MSPASTAQVVLSPAAQAKADSGRLLDAPGAAQDGPVFRFASDVNADQTTEIDRMTRMRALRPRLPLPDPRSPL